MLHQEQLRRLKFYQQQQQAMIQERKEKQQQVMMQQRQQQQQQQQQQQKQYQQQQQQQQKQSYTYITPHTRNPMRSRQSQHSSKVKSPKPKSKSQSQSKKRRHKKKKLSAYHTQENKWKLISFCEKSEMYQEQFWRLKKNITFRKAPVDTPVKEYFTNKLVSGFKGKRWDAGHSPTTKNRFFYRGIHINCM